MAKEFIKKALRFVGYYLWLFFDPSKFESMDLKKIKKIVVINLGFIGDLLAETPMISALEKKFGKVDLLIQEQFKELFKNNPSVGKIIHYSDDFESNVRILKRGRYDLAVIVWPTSLKMSLLCIKSGIPYRIGTTQPSIFEGKGFLLTRKVKPTWKTKHKVQENLDISRLVNVDIKNPKMKVYFTKKDSKVVNRFLNKSKIKDFIVLHPGKRTKFYEEYSWPPKNFAEVVDVLIDKYKLKVVITGSKPEENLANKIIDNTKSKNRGKIAVACGKLSINQLAPLFQECKLLISIDTAAVHIASAVDKKIIVLNTKYPKIWHPWTKKENYKMLRNPSVMEVLNTAELFLKNGARK